MMLRKMRNVYVTFHHEAIVITTIAQERGLLNKEFIDNYSIEKTFPEPFPYIREEKKERKKYDPYKYAEEESPEE